MPEVPKKPVPEKKVPVPTPPAKGTLFRHLYIGGGHLTLVFICKKMSNYDISVLTTSL